MAVQMRHGDYIKDAVEIVKANLGPSIVAGLLIQSVPVLNGLVAINFMSMVKAARHEGKPMDMGQLFNFENAADKIVGPLVLLLTAIACCVPPLILGFMLPIMADRPGTPWMNAFKGAIEFGKANLVPMLIHGLIMFLVADLGAIACLVGIYITTPIALAAMFLAYEDHKAAVEAAAAEGGVQL